MRADDGYRITGWEPHLPLEDTLLRQYVHGLARTNVDLARALGGRTLEVDGAVAGDLGRTNALFNAAVLTRPPGIEEWEPVVAGIEDFFAGVGPADDRVFLWSAFPTPDLRDRGWELEGYPPLLVRAGSLPLPPASDEVEVREVVDAETLADLERVFVEGFPFTSLQPFVPGRWIDERVLSMEGHRLFVGYVDSEAATAGWLTEHGGLATLTLGATLPRFRGRGCWTTMVRARLQVAGSQPSASIFADPSRHIAEQHGYLPVLRFTLWHRARRP